jgi:hypothetical protein
MTNAAQLLRRFTCLPWLACFLVALLFSGCGKPPEPAKSPAPATTNAAPAEASGPAPGEKDCFACKGEGIVACRAPGCAEGKVDCPQPCLKLSRGAWIHMNVAGHDPSELWQKFPDRDGRGGYYAFSQNHLGEIVEYQGNRAVSIGKCQVCGGTTKVMCNACKGSGKQTCPICGGKKFIPVAWNPTNNPWFDSQPDVIRLADGRVLLGRVAATVGDDLTIVTRDKKILHVKTSEVLPKAGANTSITTPAPAK